MATIWKKTDEQAGGHFAASPLPTVDNADGESVRFLVVPFREEGRPSHALILAADVEARVNGARVIAGMRVLKHKDEILVDSLRMFFSSESTPIVETYRREGSRRTPRCPVCRGELQDGQTIVRCPGCARMYHQIAATDGVAAKPCWTYSTVCRFCEHPTSMSGEPTWRPEVLEDS